MHSHFIPVSAVMGNLIDLSLLAHLHGHYVLDKYVLNFQQTIFALIYKSTTKSANQNISTRGYLFQVVKEIV